MPVCALTVRWGALLEVSVSMASGAPTLSLHERLERNFAEWLPQLEALIGPHIEAAAEQARGGAVERARRELVEHLNQSVRRMRQAGGIGGIAAVLTDATRPFCNGAAVFRVKEDVVHGERVRGVPEEAARRFTELRFPLQSARAFSAVLDSGEPAVALASQGELSPAVTEVMSHGEGTGIHLFPLPGAVLYCWGWVENAGVEVLAQVASAVLASQTGGPRPAGLVGILPVAPAGPEGGQRPPNGHSPETRRQRLTARRFARVTVAEMRLYQARAVAEGRARGDLYSVLAKAIDSARKRFRDDFMAADPGIEDYLHDELLHTLANDDARLLGPGYPGPLV